MPTFSDYLYQQSGGALQPVGNTWVQLVSNTTSTAYVSSSATSAKGLFTIGPVPAGSYTMNTGPTSSGPWTATGDVNYSVADRLGMFNVLDYGADPTGVADSLPAFNAAMTAASAGGLGAIVWVPPGTYSVSNTVVQPYNVETRLAGRNASFIKASGAFPASTAVWRLGPSGSAGVGCRFRGGAIDCNNIAGSIGCDFGAIQENSGLFESMIRNYGAFGVRVPQPGSGATPQNWSVEDVEIFSGTATGASAIGFAVLATSLSLPFRSIRKVTVFATGSTQLTTAMQIDGGSGGVVAECHVENAVNGVLVGSVLACFATGFESVTGFTNVTSLLVWANNGGQQNLWARGINPQGGTNAIVDNITGTTLTGEQAEYAIGNGANASKTIISTQQAIGLRLPKLTMTGQILHSQQTPSEATLVSGVDATAGETVRVTLTAARLVGAPLNPAVGQVLTFVLTQNATGAFAVTWNAVFKVTWSDAGNAANKRSSVMFEYDGTNWNQKAAQAPYV